MRRPREHREKARREIDASKTAREEAKLTWPPCDENDATQERVGVPVCERQGREPGSPGPARDGEGKRGEVDECLGARAGRVQHEKGRVAGPEERRGLPTDHRGSVERVADHLRQSPREHHAGVERATLGLQTPNTTAQKKKVQERERRSCWHFF